MNDKQLLKYAGAICDAHRDRGCISSHCPLAVYQCFSYRSPLDMYNQMSVNTRQNIRRIIDEHYCRYVTNGKGIEREVGNNVERKNQYTWKSITD